MSESNVEMISKERVLALMENKDAEGLEGYISSAHPIDAAVMLEEFDSEELSSFCSLLTNRTLALITEQAEDDLRIDIARALGAERLIAVMRFMQKDDIVDIIGELPINERKSVVNLMQGSEKDIVTKLLQYPDDSAGGIMTTAYIALHQDRTIQEGVDKIREIGPKTEVIETLYIINRQGQLTGAADLRDFLTAPRDRLISSIAKTNVVTVYPEQDQEEVAHLVEKYDLKSIPVVNAKNQILGIITVDDIIDVIVEEYNEDILEMAGVSKEESLDTTLWESVRLRLPWLLVNLLTAFLASLTIKLFEGTISQVVALSSTMTIVTGMGGNAGSQTGSIMVRELVNNDVKFSRVYKAFIKEIFLGIINGAVTGLVTGIAAYFIYGNGYLSLILLVAMIGNLIIAGVFGFLIPLVLKRCHADPAVASTIFLTTATDVLGFFIFLGLAKLFLPKLL